MSMNLLEKWRVNSVNRKCCSERRRPRILHLIYSFEGGGTERQAVELLKRIDPTRYDVKIAALRRRGPLYREIEDRFPAIPEFPLSSFYNANAIRQLKRFCALLTAERIDIIHTHEFYSGMIGVVAGRLTGTRVIVSQRNLRLSDRLVHKWGQRFIIRLAHRVLVNAEAIRDQIVLAGSAPPEKLVVVRNGLRLCEPLKNEAALGLTRRLIHDALCLELGIEKSARLIGIVANLRPVKGHRYLMQAAPGIIRDHPRVHFVLVGDGELREEIQNQALHLGIAAHVHLLGWRADAAGLNAAFDLAVLASLREGLPNSVMEAMAAATPVVATAVGGTGELITDGETGFLVSAGHCEALTKGICRALADEYVSQEIGMRGRAFVLSRFGFQRMVAEVQGLYDRLAPE